MLVSIRYYHCRYTHPIYLGESNSIISELAEDCIFSRKKIDGKIFVGKMVSVIINMQKSYQCNNVSKYRGDLDQIIQKTLLLEASYSCSISTDNMTHAIEKDEIIQKTLYLPEIQIKNSVEFQYLKLNDIL